MSTSSPQSLAVARLYVALMGRAPDAEGFAFWRAALDNGASVATLASGFLASPEARAIYPSGQTSEQFVTSFYTSVFGRAPDPQGLAFWSAALATQGGAQSPAARAALVLQIAEVASTPLTGRPEGITDAAYLQTVADRGRFANQVEFSVYFADQLKSQDVALAKSTLALVTSDPMSMVSATKQALGIVDPVVPPSEPTPEPTLTITAVDTAAEIQSKFLAYPGTNATVDAHGMDMDRLTSVGENIAKVGSLTNVPTLVLGGLSDAATSGLLGKATANTAQVLATGASAAELTTLLTNLDKVENAGISGVLSLSKPQFDDVSATLASKLASASEPVLRITGTTGKDTLDLSTWTDKVRVDAGGGADTIKLNGAGNNIVFIQSRAESQGTIGYRDSSTANMDTISGITSTDILRFSTAENVFGSGITYGAGVIAATGSAQAVTANSLLELWSEAIGAFGRFPSSSNAPKIYFMHVTGGALAGNSFVILNDDDPFFNENDTTIALVGATVDPILQMGV